MITLYYCTTCGVTYVVPPVNGICTQTRISAHTPPESNRFSRILEVILRDPTGPILMVHNCGGRIKDAYFPTGDEIVGVRPRL